VALLVEQQVGWLEVAVDHFGGVHVVDAFE